MYNHVRFIARAPIKFVNLCVNIREGQFGEIGSTIAGLSVMRWDTPAF